METQRWGQPNQVHVEPMPEFEARQGESEGASADASWEPWIVAVSTFAASLGIALALLGGPRQFNVDHDFVYSSARACGVGESCALVGPWNTIGVHLGPGFVYFLAAFLGFSPDPWASFVVLLVLSSLAAASLAWVSTARFGLVGGIGTGLFAATNPAGLRVLATGLSSALGPLVVAGIALLSLRWNETQSRRTLVAIFVLVGAGMQCHSLVTLLFLVPLGLRALSGRGSIVGTAVLGACVVLVLHLPWLLHYGRVGFPDPSTLGVSPSGSRVPDALLLGPLAVAGVSAWQNRRDARAASRPIGVGLGPFALVVVMGIALGAWRPYYGLIGLPFLSLGLGQALSAHAARRVPPLRWAAALCVVGAVMMVPVHVFTGPPGAARLSLDAQLEVVEHLAEHGWAGKRLSATVHGPGWDLDEMGLVYLEAWKLREHGSTRAPARGSGDLAGGPLQALVLDHCSALEDGFAVATYRLMRATSPSTVAIYETRLDPVRAIARAGTAECTSQWPGPPSHPQITGHLLRDVGTGPVPEIPTSLWPKRFSEAILADLEAHAAAAFCAGGSPSELTLMTRFRPGPDERSLVVRAGMETRVSAAIGRRRYEPHEGVRHAYGGDTQRWIFPLGAGHGPEPRTVEITLRPTTARVPIRTHLVDVYETPSGRCPEHATEGHAQQDR